MNDSKPDDISSNPMGFEKDSVLLATWNKIFGYTADDSTHSGIISTEKTRQHHRAPPVGSDDLKDAFQRALGRQMTFIAVETIFDKPTGFYSIPRKLYDAQTTNEPFLQVVAGMLLAKYTTAVKEEEIANVVLLIKAMKKKFAVTVNSFITMYFNMRCQEHKELLTWDGKNAESIADVKKAYKTGPPTKAMLSAIYEVFWTNVDKDHVLKLMIEFHVLHTYKLWPGWSSLTSLNVAQTGKMKRSSIHSHISFVITNNQRKIFQDTKVPHGVTIHHTLKLPILLGNKPSKGKRRGQGPLRFPDFATGWAEYKHRIKVLHEWY